MSDHGAAISWRPEGEFRTGRYSRAHEWRFDGGLVVPASASPGVVPAPWSDAHAIDPEEALIASVASCHMLWFLDLARRAGLDVAAYDDEPRGTMGRDEDGRVALTVLTLRPVVSVKGAAPGEDAMRALHEEAHRRCFVANSLKTQIVVTGSVVTA